MTFCLVCQIFNKLSNFFTAFTQILCEKWPVKYICCCQWQKNCHKIMLSIFSHPRQDIATCRKKVSQKIPWRVIKMWRFQWPQFQLLFMVCVSFYRLLLFFIVIWSFVRVSLTKTKQSLTFLLLFFSLRRACRYFFFVQIISVTDWVK